MALRPETRAAVNADLALERIARLEARLESLCRHLGLQIERAPSDYVVKRRGGA